MGSIESFMDGLRETRRIMGERLRLKRGQKEIAGALDEMKGVEDTLSWMPKPKTPGGGTTGDGTKRMANRGRP